MGLSIGFVISVGRMLWTQFQEGQKVMYSVVIHAGNLVDGDA